MTTFDSDFNDRNVQRNTDSMPDTTITTKLPSGSKHHMIGGSAPRPPIQYNPVAGDTQALKLINRNKDKRGEPHTVQYIDGETCAEMARSGKGRSKLNRTGATYRQVGRNIDGTEIIQNPDPIPTENMDNSAVEAMETTQKAEQIRLYLHRQNQFDDKSQEDRKLESLVMAFCQRLLDCVEVNDSANGHQTNPIRNQPTTAEEFKKDGISQSEPTHDLHDANVLEPTNDIQVSSDIIDNLKSLETSPQLAIEDVFIPTRNDVPIKSTEYTLPNNRNVCTGMDNFKKETCQKVMPNDIIPICSDFQENNVVMKDKTHAATCNNNMYILEVDNKSTEVTYNQQNDRKKHTHPIKQKQGLKDRLKSSRVGKLFFKTETTAYQKKASDETKKDKSKYKSKGKAHKSKQSQTYNEADNVGGQSPKSKGIVALIRSSWIGRKLLRKKRSSDIEGGVKGRPKTRGCWRIGDLCQGADGKE